MKELQYFIPTTSLPESQYLKQTWLNGDQHYYIQARVNNLDLLYSSQSKWHIYIVGKTTSKYQTNQHISTEIYITHYLLEPLLTLLRLLRHQCTNVLEGMTPFVTRTRRDFTTMEIHRNCSCIYVMELDQVTTAVHRKLVGRSYPFC